MTSKTRAKGTRRETRRGQTEQAEGLARDAHAEAGSPASSSLTIPDLPTMVTATAERRPTKALHLREMLARENGASLAQMTEATGWQAHTVQAALSGLRKSGLTLDRTRRGQDTIYRIVAGDASAGGAADNPDATSSSADPTSGKPTEVTQ
ncbi:DUF3489 domain-containing protein [Tabrizicola soli]|uniref:DUF3489 domain-containing protein n=1 Tax=Tabrizicola soli TaxID=2185115 RepID=A0ABV7DUH0_9RHOB|nr:DUF3489 domain-containing protein [Tabrizicola soli]